MVLPDVIAAIGNTPLIRLKRASELTGCDILGKAEFLNPGQSVKDRAALFIIRDAVARGGLRPGGTIVEGTAGNTGIGLALVANALGFRTVIVIPNTQSEEKKDALRLMGAELIEVPANALSRSQQLCAPVGTAGRRDGADGKERRDLGQPVRQCRQPPGPYRNHRPGNLARRPNGKIDGFICAVGSGGTLAGTAIALKQRNPDVKIAAADPLGAAIYSWIKTGKLEVARLLHHRGHRPGPRHRQSGRRADRRCL